MSEQMEMDFMKFLPEDYKPVEGEKIKTFERIFLTKDSGERQEFSTGMVRDTAKGKARYDLVWKPGLKRVAELYGRGSLKYSARNWEKAATQEELDRFMESANRHFEQWFAGDVDEDHMSAVVFNLFGAEMVKAKLAEKAF